MPIKTLLVCCGLLFLLLLTGCSNPVAVGSAFLAPTTPPLNTILFGPCGEEFGMPDSRRANCEIHYRLWGGEAPWVTRQKYFAATAYQPGELQCTLTRGQLADCAVVTGPPKQPPYIAAPNNLRSE